MTSDQHFSDHVTHDDLNSSKSEIGQWHPLAFFSQKMISAETWYKTHNQELLAIVKASKTLRHNLEGCKYKVFIFTEYNNLSQFMDMQSLSSRQVYWAQKLSWYYFQIDYHQGKANIAADTLFCFPQRRHPEEKTLRDENSQILWYL